MFGLPSRGRWAVVGAVAAAFAAAGLAGGASAAPRTPDAVLLGRYQPVLVFHPQEAFRPTKVQSFVSDSVLERFVGTSQTQMLSDAFWTVVDPDPEPGDLPPAAPGVLYRLNQPDCSAGAPLAGLDCFAAAAATGSGGPAVYGRVVRTETRTVLQYWLFYYDNPQILPQTAAGFFWQSHEGDWELVNVVLDTADQPLEAAYSEHCYGLRADWSDVGRRPAGSTHPVVYVALGSHANYFAPGQGPAGAVPIDFAACAPAALGQLLGSLQLPIVDQVVDGLASGAVVGPPGSGLPAATIHPIDGTVWSSFGGRWGESEYFHSPIALGPYPAGTTLPLGLAPASPANQATWNVATVLAWPKVP